jgi:hypothetical protein
MKRLLFFICLFFTFCCWAADVHINDWSVDLVDSSTSYKTYRVKVTLRNSGGTAGNYYVYLHGEDGSGYPIVKERVRIETYMPAFGEIKDTDEVILRRADADAVKTWVIRIQPL